MLVYCIVVTYNGIKWIDKCFGSLIQSDIKMKIIAVDNGSTDGTIEKLKNDYPDVELLSVGKNIGFGKANNIGLRMAKEAKADYTLLINQDARIEPDTVYNLIKLHEQNTAIGIISPLHIDIENKLLIDKHCSITFSDKLLSDAILKNKIGNLYEIESIHAAIWLISKRCLETVGGFDPIFHYRQEDIDYINRVKRNNFLFGLAPNIKAYHRGAIRRFEKITFKKRVLYLKGEKLIMFKVHLSDPFIKLFLIAQIDCFFDSLKFLFKLKLKRALVYFVVMIDLVLLIPSIINSRKRTINDICPFL